MSYPVTITFRNMAPSTAIEKHLRERAAKLDAFSDRILGCRVTVESPHRHHHKGKAYHVHVELSVPGRDIVINRAPTRLSTAKLDSRSGEAIPREDHRPSKHGAHKDLYVAIRDAFNAAGRKLQDYVRREGGAVKAHDRARIAG
jgi:ribosome-associated translation inhibitor RaiA